MDRDGADDRIAELEHQLAQQRRIAELERQLAEAKAAEPGRATAPGSQDSAQAATRGEQPYGLPPAPGPAGSTTPDDPVRLQRELLHKLGVSDADWQAARREAWSRRRPPRQRRFTMAALALALIGPLYGVVAGVTPELPSSAMWMSGIVCRSSYHLAYHNEGYHYGRAPGFRGSFDCVGEDGSYHVNYLAISVLQTLLVILVVLGVVALGIALWRLVRTTKTTVG